jgi:hypothetical protein
MKMSDTMRNNRANTIETTIGTSPRLMIYTGDQPANITSPATGVLIFNFTLPSDWLTAASGGVKNKLGTWSANALANGTVGYFRITNNSMSTTHMQGSITVASGNGDLTMTSTDYTSGQNLLINTFTWTEAYA